MEKRYNKVSGMYGESAACKYLEKHKYKILEKNYKTQIGEIDLIARQKKALVFVEVKRRTTLAFGRPSEAVNVQKQAKIRRVAEEYLIRNKLLGCEIRFDVIEIVDNEINHIQNAF
ncbi:MAG: YraN family protein [Clostridia bacterium]|nr:YraN family protein [Clostridia bacterium]